MLCLALILGACVMTPPLFDETQWKDAVANQDSSKLYESNYKNGVFFNPWMPMQEKRLAELMRWRFSRKATYTEYFIPTQWGTFQLGDNPPGYPVLDLKQTIKRMGRNQAPFMFMNIGEIITISHHH